MAHQLDDLVRHNTWANRVLLDFALDQRPETLDLDIKPGGFSTILETFRHIVYSEASYLRRLTHPVDGVDFDKARESSLLEVRDLHERVAAAWERLLESEYDQATVAEARGDGQIFHVTHGVVLAQAMHHGSEHRAQISDIFGYHGIEPPDVSSWGYALATGRSWVTGTDEE